MARIWITGAKGFIGTHLGRRLSQQNHTVSGVGHGTWATRDAEMWGVARWLNGDVDSSNLDTLAAATGCPDVVFHLAGAPR